MSLRAWLTDFSKGDNLGLFWWLYRRRSRAKSRLARDIATFLLNRCAHRHGGYVGPGAVIQGRPELPHGLHGVFISRYAVVGPGCRIYQNVTIGEVNRKAPVIGDGCWIGGQACPHRRGGGGQPGRARLRHGGQPASPGHGEGGWAWRAV